MKFMKQSLLFEVVSEVEAFAVGNPLSTEL